MATKCDRVLGWLAVAGVAVIAACGVVLAGCDGAPAQNAAAAKASGTSEAARGGANAARAGHGHSAGAHSAHGAHGAAVKTTGPLKIVATTAQIGDIARNLTQGVSEVTVAVLLGEGVDPHTYKLTRSDAAQLHSGDLVLFSGLHLEGKMGEVISELARSGKRVVEVGAAIPEAQLLVPEGAADQHDPHFWMDPELFTFATGVVSREVLALTAGRDAAGAKVTENARAYNAALRELDEEIRGLMEAIPQTQRVLITSHDAFGYFGRRYGLAVHAVQGISTESEAGLADVSRLITLITAGKVPAVFVESSVSDRTIKSVIEQSAKRGQIVKLGGELFSDAMGKPGTIEGTYIGMMRHNARTISAALGGKNGASEGGSK